MISSMSERYSRLLNDEDDSYMLPVKEKQVDKKPLLKDDVTQLTIRNNVISFHEQSLALLQNEREMFARGLMTKYEVITDEGWTLDFAESAFIKQEKTDE